MATLRALTSFLGDCFCVCQQERSSLCASTITICTNTDLHLCTWQNGGPWMSPETRWSSFWRTIMPSSGLEHQSICHHCFCYSRLWPNLAPKTKTTLCVSVLIQGGTVGLFHWCETRYVSNQGYWRCCVWVQLSIFPSNYVKRKPVKNNTWANRAYMQYITTVFMTPNILFPGSFSSSALLISS